MDGFRDEQGTEHVGEVALEPVAVVSKRRPRALWAVLAAVAVAAGALVVTSADDEGNQRPGLPVDLAGSAGGSGAEAAADSSMMAWVTYVAGDELPALGGDATAYRLPGDVDEAQVRQLADAFGLDAAVEPGSDGTWSASVQDVGQLVVHTGAGAYWSFSSQFGEDCMREADDLVTCTSSGGGTSSGSAGAIACDGDLPISPECTATTLVDGKPCGAGKDCVEPTTTTYTEGAIPPCSADECAGPECPADEPCDPIEPPEPEPAPDLPSEEEARQIALDVVAASGVDLDGALVTADLGYDWYVTVEPVVDGIPSSLLSYVEVGSGGAVVMGSGSIGRPEALGEYPLVDTRAAIDRANAQSGIGVGTPLGSPEAMSRAGSGAEGGADVGGTTGDESVSTVIEPDPCVVPDGASDGCGGGTTGCGDDGCADVGTATTMPCKVQPDGREICEYDSGCAGTAGGTDGGTVTTLVCEDATCPPADAGGDIAVGAPATPVCTPPLPCAPPGAEGPPESQECSPMPEPQPLEVVLVEAEPSLVLLPATDGSPDAYLVPAYRFTGEDGSTIDLPAVSDEALTGPSSTDSTAPNPSEPEPVPEPQPCEVLEEQDASGTTHTIQTCTTPSAGAHHVDAFVMDGHCTWLVVKVDGKVWWTPGYYQDDLFGWTQPTEAGTFTINEDGSGDFVADADPERVATLVPWEQGPEGPLCE